MSEDDTRAFGHGEGWSRDHAAERKITEGVTMDQAMRAAGVRDVPRPQFETHGAEIDPEPGQVSLASSEVFEEIDELEPVLVHHDEILPKPSPTDELAKIPDGAVWATVNYHETPTRVAWLDRRKDLIAQQIVVRPPHVISDGDNDPWSNQATVEALRTLTFPNSDPLDDEWDETIEDLAEKAHNAWFVEKYSRGVRVWPNERGVEQMVPYEELGENVREFDRVVVRSVLRAIDDKGLLRDPDYESHERNGDDRVLVSLSLEEIDALLMFHPTEKDTLGYWQRYSDTMIARLEARRKIHKARDQMEWPQVVASQIHVKRIISDLRDLQRNIELKMRGGGEAEINMGTWLVQAKNNAEALEKLAGLDD